MTSTMIAQQLADRAGRKPHNRLRSWLRRHYAELEEAREQAGASYEDIAAIAAENGILDAKGKPPTRFAVRAAMERIREKARPKVPAPGAFVHPPPVTVLGASGSDRPTSDANRSSFSYNFAPREDDKRRLWGKPKS